MDSLCSRGLFEPRSTVPSSLFVVLVRPLGDQKHRKYRWIEITQFDEEGWYDIFFESEISKLIGIPLGITAAFVDNDREKGPYFHQSLMAEGSFDYNSAAASLFTEPLDSKFYPGRPTYPTAGDLVVWRKDLKPLYPGHVVALTKFVRNFQNVYGDRELPMTMTKCFGGVDGITWTRRQFLEEYCTNNNFSAYFDYLRQRMLLNGDESWRDIPNPYDI